MGLRKSARNNFLAIASSSYNEASVLVGRGAGVAEQGCLLSSCTGKTGAGGSNPPLSVFLLRRSLISWAKLI